MKTLLTILFCIFAINFNGICNEFNFTFAEIEYPFEPQSVGLDDFNKDGYLDLVALSKSAEKLYLFLNNGYNQFPDSVAITSNLIKCNYPNPNYSDISTGDFNLDGYPDIVITNRTKKIYILTNNQDNTFTIDSINTGVNEILGVGCGDFDSDKVDDIVVHRYQKNNCKLHVYSSLGDGTFNQIANIDPHSLIPSGSDGMQSLIVGDFNNDAKSDIIIGQDDDADAGQTWLLIGDGTGAFSYGGESYDTNPLNEGGNGHPGGGFGDAFDFNLDGNLDILTCSGGNSQLAFFIGDGTGLYGDPQVLNTYDTDFDHIAAPPRNWNGEVICIASARDNTTGYILKPVRGLVAKWTCDENNGTILTDLTGNGFNGTIQNGAWTAGIYGSALSFNGSNTTVEFDSPVLNEPPYTICAWVKPASTASSYRYFITNGGETGVDNYGFYLAQYSGGVSFSVKYNGIGRTCSSPLLPIDEWTFVCGTWDGTDNENSVKLYINGDLESSSTPSTISGDEEVNLRFGNTIASGASHYYDGSLDEVEVYNSVLNATEVDALYQKYKPEEPLVENGIELRFYEYNDGNWEKADITSENITWNNNSFDPLEDGNRIGLDYTNHSNKYNELILAQIDYNSYSFSFDFYYPEYLGDQNKPLYYNIYLYPDREYFRGDSSQIAWIVTTKTPQTANSTEPLLMIEGTYPKSDYWSYGEQEGLSFRQLFEDSSDFDVYQFNYPSLQNIRYSAAILGEVAKDIQSRFYNEQSKINILTHSQGGLVARAYTVGMGVYESLHVDYENEFKSIIQIAPPNHGTYEGFKGEYKTLEGILAEIFFEFDIPATKMMASGSRFLWELNNVVLFNLQNNTSNCGHLVIAGTENYVLNGKQSNDGLVSVASASLLSKGNIPLVALPAAHSRNHSTKPGLLEESRFRLHIVNLASEFIKTNFNNESLFYSINSLTQNEGVYVDSIHNENLGGIDRITEFVYGSVILKPSNFDNLAKIPKEIRLSKKTDNGFFKGVLIPNNNDDPHISNDDSPHYDGIGPLYYIVKGGADNRLSIDHDYYEVLKPDIEYEVRIIGQLQDWSIKTEEGQCVLIEEQLEIPPKYIRTTAACPVDLQIIDPDGFVIDSANSTGDNWIYYHDDINNDGEIDHIIDIADPIEGNYTINIIPHDTASESDSFSVYIETESSIDTLVNNQLIGDNELFSYDHTLDSPLDASENDNTGIIPTDFVLNQNYPNPFNPSTTIEYSLPTRSRVNISVYNILGRKVTTLINENQSAGNHSVTWNGANNQNQQVSSGIYFYRIETNDFTTTKKMTLLK